MAVAMLIREPVLFLAWEFVGLNLILAWLVAAEARANRTLTGRLGALA
jgi:hypothetical protein